MALACLGLFLSSFALLVLQSTMGGLQNKLINRSKAVQGHGVVHLDNWPEAKAQEFVSQYLNKSHAVLEFELEMLIRNGASLTPFLLHGVSQAPFPMQHFTDLVLPYDVAVKAKSILGERLELISPAHVDTFLEDIPRSIHARISELIVTDVPEIDHFHGWIRLTAVQNLLRQRIVNRLRLMEPVDGKLLQKNLQQFSQDNQLTANYKTWEMENETLVHALNLENTVMLFLFVGMTILVAFCILSGLLLFLENINKDLASYWILGAHVANLTKASYFYLVLLSFVASVAGVTGAFAFLTFMDNYVPDFMPDVFVDRRLPIFFTFKNVFVSFLVPFLMGSLVGTLGLRRYNTGDWLRLIRSSAS